MRRQAGFAAALLGGVVWLAAGAWAEVPPGEASRLDGERITQEQIESGELSLDEIRLAGLRMFTTPFTKLDGYGDGPMNPVDPLAPGGRPTLQGSSTLLRMNGLDSQTCIECHATISNATVPPTFGIGGVGGSVTNAIIGPSSVDVGDEDLDGKAGFDGRLANPPFVFGVGRVELLGLEMTLDLQALKARAVANPGVRIELLTKGVHFGAIVADTLGNVDTSAVEGVGADLVVRPFGRKGEFATTREFDIGAMQFHFGMQPIEAVGEHIDSDGDGSINEIMPGELSALSVFLTSLDPPRMEPLTTSARRGLRTFKEVGCAACHVPAFDTEGRHLPLRFPEIATHPAENVYYTIELGDPRPPAGRRGRGGVHVPLFADLKRHDMGPDLAENFAQADERTNREFTTARLWGVADTAPYLHDGRATTLTEAILWHGGEAREAREAFEALADSRREQVLAFLRSLRTPRHATDDLLRMLGGDDEGSD